MSERDPECVSVCERVCVFGLRRNDRVCVCEMCVQPPSLCPSLSQHQPLLFKQPIGPANITVSILWSIGKEGLAGWLVG